VADVEEKTDNEGSVPANSVIEPPRGRYPGRLDDKGRLKVPSVFQEYFASLPDKRLFVTSLDRRSAQIYPIELWKANEKIFDGYVEDLEALRNISFNALDLGSVTEMDAQGRITVNPELRRKLGLEDQELHLWGRGKGRVEIITEALYQEQLRLVEIQKTAADLNKLRQAGLQ
jgi:MraZ protein